jgi:hypothetical protein
LPIVDKSSSTPPGSSVTLPIAVHPPLSRACTRMRSPRGPSVGETSLSYTQSPRAGIVYETG